MFHSLDTWDPAPLRRALTRAAYTQESLKQLDLAGVPYQGRAAALFRESLPSGTPMKALARLFMLGDTVPAADLLITLGVDIGSLADLGLLTFADGEVRSNACLVPYGGGWFASDFMRRHTEAPSDYVMGLSPTTRLLFSLAPKQRVASALDMGCGAGWLAMQFHRSGIRASAADISPHAIELARFNEKLAGISGIDWQLGSWFEPFDGQCFDLICCNPPYAQSPGGPLTFRETAPGAEPPCAHVLRHAADHLNPGGIACVLLNWSHAGPDDWTHAPLDWAPAVGVRRWLFQFDSLSPAEYAWRWLRPDPRFTETEAARIELDRWLAHYAEAGTRAVSSGFIILQQCEAGEEWTRTDSRMIGEIPTNASEEVVRVLTNETWLRGNPGDAELLERRYLVPDGIQARIQTVLDDQGWQQRTIQLTSPGKLSYDGQVDENLMRLLALCRDDHRPADMVAELRAKPQFSDTPELDAQIAGLTRELLRFALIAPL